MAACRSRSRPGIQLSGLQPERSEFGKKLDELRASKAGFENLKFRQAISAAIDRDSIVRLVYGSEARRFGATSGPETSIGSISPSHIPTIAGYGAAIAEVGGIFVEHLRPTASIRPASRSNFRIVTSSSNTQRMKMATLVQDDLSHLGMQVHVVPLEFRGDDRSCFPELRL